MPKNILKIGFVLDDGLDKPDGVQQYVLTLGRWLQSQGHHVRYLVGATTRTDLPELRVLSRNVAVRYNGNTLTTPLPASRRTIRELLAAEHFDVLHVQIPYSPLLAARVVAAAEPQTTIIGTFHILPYGRTQSAGTKLLGLTLKRNLKKFHAIVSVSEPARLFAKKTFGIESIVIPNPVDIKRFQP